MTVPDKDEMEREAAKAASLPRRRRAFQPRPPSLKTYAWLLLALSIWATMIGTLYEALPFFFEAGRDLWRLVA